MNRKKGKESLTQIPHIREKSTASTIPVEHEQARLFVVRNPEVQESPERRIAEPTDRGVTY